MKVKDFSRRLKTTYIGTPTFNKTPFSHFKLRFSNLCPLSYIAQCFCSTSLPLFLAFCTRFPRILPERAPSPASFADGYVAVEPVEFWLVYGWKYSIVAQKPNFIKKNQIFNMVK